MHTTTPEPGTPCRYNARHQTEGVPAAELLHIPPVGDVPCCANCAAFYRSMTPPTAGDLLRQALTTTGIPSERDGDGPSDFVVIYGYDETQIRISGSNGRENEIAFAPSEHQGWTVCHYDEGLILLAELFISDNRDFAADTTGAVATIEHFLAHRPTFLPHRRNEQPEQTDPMTNRPVAGKHTAPKQPEPQDANDVQPGHTP